MGEHLYTYDDPPSERDLTRIVRVLEQDGVIAYPSDVNWAFGCDAASPKALDRLYALKPMHPKDRPLSLIVSSIAMAAEYVNVEHAAYRMLRKAWPGPFTVLLTANRTFPRQLKDKRRVVGIRIPQAPLVLAIVERLGRPLATSSVPDGAGAASEDGDDDDGRPLPRMGYEVFERFGHALDLVLDLGGEVPGQESTIVDLTGGSPELVRRGAGDPAVFDLGG
jgi:tRNA threonylcarbamoyl adenosine modification protein (Sua5/YciO/YrdC/YwlC family)